MAILKAKNNAGEWVDVDSFFPTQGAGALHIDRISRTGTLTYDLSKYANCSRFFLIYSVGTTSKEMMCYDSANKSGYLYILNLEDGLETMNGINSFVTDNYTATYDYDSIFHAYYDSNGSFSGERGVLKCGTVVDGIYTHRYTKHTVGQSAIVIYSM